MDNSGGSAKKSLVEKLGIKEGFKVIFINPPRNYYDILGKLPPKIFLREALDGSLDFIHFFTRRKKEFELLFPALIKGLSKTGMIWVSWPKASSKIETNLNEDMIRKIGLKNEMVDTKICAVDEDWSGLKFVFRKKK